MVKRGLCGWFQIGPALLFPIFVQVVKSIQSYKTIDSPVLKYVKAYEFMEKMVKNCKFFSEFVFRMLQDDFETIPYYFRNGCLPRKFENSIIENLTIACRKSQQLLGSTPFDSMKNAAHDMISRIKDADLTFSVDDPKEYEMRFRLLCSAEDGLLKIQKFPVVLRVEGEVFMEELTRDIRLTRLEDETFHIEIREKT